MKLSKYLADYIEHELAEAVITEDVINNLQYYIQQGIEAFESTEGVKIRVIDIPTLAFSFPDEYTCPICGKDFSENVVNVTFPDSDVIYYDYLCECGEQIREVFTRDYFEQIKQ